MRKREKEAECGNVCKRVCTQVGVVEENVCQKNKSEGVMWIKELNYNAGTLLYYRAFEGG